MTNPSNLVFQSLLGLIICAILSPAYAVYTEPTRRIVLNEVINSSSQHATFPLYLRDAGRYITELYLANEDGEVDSSHERTITLQVQVDIARRGKVLRSESKQIAFAPGQPNHTLLWARTPLELPQRKNLDMTITIAGTDDVPLSANQSFRLQVTRKFEFAPVFR